MMRYVLIVLFSIFLAELSSAQGVFKFEEETHDFGKINEGDPAVHEFIFTNVGDQPIVLSNVRASCGCTTPHWTKEPVPPGETGIVSASYSSKGRPGNFHKSITITSNASTPTKVLQIKGLVEKPTPKPIYSEEELASSPRLFLEKNQYNFGTVEKGQALIKRLKISNKGKEDLEIKDMKSTCNCVALMAPPSVIKPGEDLEIEISYMPRTVKNGAETVTFYSNDRISPEVKLVLNANVVEGMGGMSIMQGSGN